MNLNTRSLLDIKSQLNKALGVDPSTFSHIWYKMRGKIRLGWREGVELHIDWK